MKIKPNTYYKIYYNEDKEWYDIVYTGNKWVYYIASKYNDNNYKIEEISKEDVFLELL